MAHIRSTKSEVEKLFFTLRLNVLTPDQVRQTIEKVKVFRQKRAGSQQVGSNPKPGDVYQSFVSEKMQSGEWKLKTKQETQTCMNLFLEIIGDKPVAYTHSDLLHFRECLLKLPPAFQKNPQIRCWTIKEILEKPWQKTLSLSRVNRILNGIISFFTWSVKHQIIKESPCLGIRFSKGRVQKSEKPRNPFLPEELRVLLAQPEFVDPGEVARHPERMWVPLIALHSGMRLNEVCQLYADDLRQIDGVMVFDVRVGRPDQSLKTESSTRQVPVHPDLLRVGFENYLAKVKSEGHERLFPMFRKGIDGYGHSVRNWFMKLMKRIVISRCFHELRHSFAFYLKQAGVDESNISELLGHSRMSVTSRYTHQMTNQRKLEILSLLKFPIEGTT